MHDVKVLVLLDKPADEVTFRLYSSGYRLVREVKWTSLPAGAYTGIMEKSKLSELSNGIYYCRISVSFLDKTTETRKIAKLVVLR